MNSRREYEKFKLKCGHEGNIVWRSSDGRTIGVRGSTRRCPTCMKWSDAGVWRYTVHLIDVSGEPHKMPRSPNGAYRFPKED